MQDYLANELQTTLERFTNQARFVQMIVDKQLVVSNRKKADVVADLHNHGFLPFPRSMAKDAGDNEPTVEEDEEEPEVDANESMADFDYLLGMAIWSLTEEKIAKLKEQAAEREIELQALLEKSPKDLWNADLDLFLQEWEVSRVYALTLWFMQLNDLRADRL